MSEHENIPEVVNVESEVVEESKHESNLNSAFVELFKAIKQEKLIPVVEHFARRLQEEWLSLDSKWSQQYGEGYQNLKKNVETFSTNYQSQKTQFQNDGINPLEQKQSQWENKASEFAVFVAQKEQQLKARLLEKWQRG